MWIPSLLRGDDAVDDGHPNTIGAPIARALLESAVLFADEPAGNLGKHAGDAIIELPRNVNRDGTG